MDWICSLGDTMGIGDKIDESDHHCGDEPDFASFPHSTRYTYTKKLFKVKLSDFSGLVDKLVEVIGPCETKVALFNRGKGKKADWAELDDDTWNASDMINLELWVDGKKVIILSHGMKSKDINLHIQEVSYALYKKLEKEFCKSRGSLKLTEPQFAIPR